MVFREELKEGGLHSTPGLTKLQGQQPAGERQRLGDFSKSWNPREKRAPRTLRAVGVVRGRGGGGLSLKPRDGLNARGEGGAWNFGEFKVLGDRPLGFM